MILNKLKSKLDINKTINYLIILYAFCLPISRAGIGVFSALLLVLLPFKKDIKKDLKFIFENKFIIIFFIFILYSTISLLYAQELYKGFKYILRYWYYLPIATIATTLEKKYIKYVISAFFMGMLISELISYGIFLELIKFKNVSPSDPTPFMNHLQYSVFVTFTSLYLLNHLIFIKEPLKYKIPQLIFFTTVTANLFINGGRIGYVAFFVTIFLVFMVNIKSKLKALLISFISVSIVFFIAYKASPTFQQRLAATQTELKIISDFKFHSSFGQRLAAWYLTGKIAKDNPILGVGVGDELEVLKQYVKQETEHDFKKLNGYDHFHNIFAQTIVQLGIIGLVLIVLLFFYLYKIQIKDNYFKNVKYIFITIFLITCLTGNMFHQQFTMAIFSLMVGILLSFEIQDKKETAQIFT